MKLLFSFLLFFICSITTDAQKYFRQWDIQLLTTKDGLSNNTLTEIHQDKDGFLWLGTDVGLSRYDGIHFHNYDLINVEPHSIASIYETPDQLLWSQVANHNEIVCFDKMNGRYIPLTTSRAGLMQEILDIHVVQDKLYAITDKELMELQIERNADGIKLTAQTLPNIKGSLSNLYGHEDKLCLLTQGSQIIFYDLTGKKADYINYADLDIADAGAVTNIHLYNNNLWVCTQGGEIIYYDTKAKASRKVNWKSEQHLNQHINLRDIVQVDDRTFIFATGTSLFTIRFDSNNFLQAPVHILNLTENEPYYEAIFRNRITQIFFDGTNNVLWVGTSGRGLLKLNATGESVNRIQLSNEIKVINGITQDVSGIIWLASENNGVYKSTGGELSPYMHFVPWEKANPNSNYCLYKDKNGGLWFGDEKGNILWNNPMTNATINFQPQPDGTPGSASAILNLYLNSRNHLWIATEKGIMVYNYQTNECLAHLPYPAEVKKVTAICEDGDGTMWLGTEKGLVCAKREGKQIQLTTGYEKKAGLTPGKVLALYLNNYNQLFASYTDKIIQIDGKEKTVSSTMILQKDLSNGHIGCMVDDKNGNTWLGTNSGIITVNNKNNVSYTYAFPESFYDVCRLNDGRLLWANSTGLLYFEPRILKDDSSTRQYHISDIDVNYKKVEIGEKVNGQIILDKPAYLIDQLTLNHNNNNLVIYLSDLMYGASANKVEFRLLPIDTEWRAGYNDQIKLSNMEAGEYILEIKPVYPVEGHELITRLPISVNRYWATSGWAIAGYILVAIAISLIIWLYINRKILKRQRYQAKEERLKEKLEEETTNRKVSEKNHQLRDQVRYALAQELRTPLSLVTAPLKEMIDNSAFPESFLQKAKVAYRSSISMQDVCNQLLSIHQEEDYGAKFNVSHYSASSIADDVVRNSYELLNVSPINLYYDKDNRINTELWIDRKKISFVLRNILSNAYRHISYSGNIRFNVSISNINGKELCLFTIEDDGKEMVEESSVTFLGADNYIAPSNNLHPELGIEIMKSTALSHNGEIKIEQEKNKGTRVTLYLPLDKKHWEGKDNVVFIDPEKVTPENQEVDIITIEDKKIQSVKDSITANPINSPETKYKLLVIEDHADIRLYLKVLFSSTYNIIMAENGEEGVRMARKEMPDLVITDVMMPVMNGFECCRILKEDLKTCHIPIILLTALTDDENVVKGIELGADDYILKPFNPEILRTKVKRLIKSRIELKQIYTKLLMPSMSSIESPEVDEETASLEDPFITQILSIVNENLQNTDFNVKKLAEMLNMSQPTLYRKVKQLTNFTIIELVRGVRLKRSAELLKTRQYNVQEVAEMVGYNDIPTFRKHFVDFYGTTPSTFNNKDEAEDKK